MYSVRLNHIWSRPSRVLAVSRQSKSLKEGPLVLKIYGIDRRSETIIPQEPNFDGRKALSLAVTNQSQTPADVGQTTVKYVFRLRGLVYFLIAVAGAILLFAIVNGEEHVIPFINRKRFAILTPEQEVELGDMLAEDLIEKHKSQILPDNHPAMIQLTSVVNEICSKNGLGERKLVIITDGKPNAFVLGGKYIFVFTGLGKALASVEQVAFVIGHEIGHTLAGHWGEGLVRTGLTTAAAILVGLFSGHPSAGANLLQMALVLPKSRKNELEADIIGLHLATRACFDPSVAIEVCDNLAKANGDGGGLTSTHPAWLERKENIQNCMKSEEFQTFMSQGTVCPRRKPSQKLHPMPVVVKDAKEKAAKTEPNK